MSEEGTPPPDDLEAFEAHAWQLLEAAATRPGAPFRNGVVGTSCDDGPSLRTVVLRDADAKTRRVVFHTDRRSPKVAELSADPTIAWVFYDDGLKLQLRLRGRAIVHLDDAFADAQWRKTSHGSKRVYHAVAAPGTSSTVPTDGLPASLDEATDDEIARPNFAVVGTQVLRLEVLHLHAAGHRRAVFDYGDDGVLRATRWLIP